MFPFNVLAEQRARRAGDERVLYGQLFYTAAILVGRVWILLILVLILV
ncbi:hypothetical protein MYX04_02405 [Nitrospiraceae bacterium AH_259_D15_M11_P09]|nr:hypothetical protein [Nitrospiraceae bacterium AH_259_D15_M11_P09]